MDQELTRRLDRIDTKLDDLHEKLSEKASAEEVGRLRHRIGNLEQSKVGGDYLIAEFREMQGAVKAHDTRLAALEGHDIAEGAVQSYKRWLYTIAAGFLINLVLQFIQLTGGKH